MGTRTLSEWLRYYARVAVPCSSDLERLVQMADTLEQDLAQAELRKQTDVTAPLNATAKDIGELCHQQVEALIRSGEWKGFPSVVDYVVQQSCDFTKRENK